MSSIHSYITSQPSPGHNSTSVPTIDERIIRCLPHWAKIVFGDADAYLQEMISINLLCKHNITVCIWKQKVKVEDQNCLSALNQGHIKKNISDSCSIGTIFKSPILRREHNLELFVFDSL